MLIYSVIMLVLTVLQNMAMESNLTLECHNTLNRLTRERVVEMIWVPELKVIKSNK